MKKSLLTFIMLFAVAALFAQSVPREMVAMEIATGTWCTYCPGAAMGAEDLLANGCKVAVIENHNGDSYANTYSNNRNSYYAVTGYPTAVFDGITRVVGGSHSVSMYTSYLPKYNQRINIPAMLSMETEMTHTGLDYTAIITVTKVGTITATDLKLHFFVTQSNIQQNWQGQTHLEHVTRLMVPDQNGTPVSFTSGDVQTYTLNFTLDAAWPVEDVEFVTFVQGQSGKEVFNAMKKATIELNVDYTASATVINPGDSVTFTNLTTGGYIGASEEYTWSFPGGTPETSTDKNPVITYDQCGAFDVTLTVDRGGQIITVTKPAYITAGTPVYVVVTPNDTTCYDEPITLDATTPNATYLWQPGGSTAPTFVVSYPEYGLGLHFFSVTVSTPDGCVTQKTLSTFFDACLGINEKPNSVSASVYPNPNHGVFTVELNSSKNQVVDLKVVNVANTTVYEEKNISVSGKLPKNLKLENLSGGMYFIIIKSDESNVVQKLFIQK